MLQQPTERANGQLSISVDISAQLASPRIAAAGTTGAILPCQWVTGGLSIGWTFSFQSSLNRHTLQISVCRSRGSVLALCAKNTSLFDIRTRFTRDSSHQLTRKKRSTNVPLASSQIASFVPSSAPEAGQTKHRFRRRRPWRACRRHVNRPKLLQATNVASIYERRIVAPYESKRYGR